MRKYKLIIMPILLTVYIIWSYYQYELIRKDRKAFLSDLNITVVDIQKKVLENNDSMYNANYIFWDMQKSAILETREEKQRLIETENKDKEENATKDLNLKNRVICLDEVCWEFLGVVTVNNETVVTLLSKGKDAKLQTFRLNDMLLENVMIIDIKMNSMRLIDRQKNKEIDLKLFDIDVKKYIPNKGKKEKNE